MADGHTKAPRRGSQPLSAPAAAAKEEQPTQHGSQRYHPERLRCVALAR